MSEGMPTAKGPSTPPTPEVATKNESAPKQTGVKKPEVGIKIPTNRDRNEISEGKLKGVRERLGLPGEEAGKL